MDRAYWDELADRYDQEIFSVRDHDSAGLISGIIEKLAEPNGTAADLGCGVGKFTPLLAESFGQVEACDLSPKLLAHAQHTCRRLENVHWETRDLTAGRPDSEPVDFVLCVNVLIAASLNIRMRLLENVAGHVKAGGHLLLVVPSLESSLYTDFRRVDWCLREGLGCDEAIRDSLPRHGSVRNLQQGVRPIEGIATKHYLREELTVLLEDRGFELLTLRKLQYPWSTEFDSPPDWLDDPLPWDWLALGRRREA